MFSLWDDLLNLIFPPRPICPFCGERVQAGSICGRCLEIIEGYRREPYCSRCGRFPGRGAAFLAAGGAGGLCFECRKREWPFVMARAAGPHEGILKDAVHRFKYAGQRGLAGHLAGLMFRVVQDEPQFAGVDLVVPVPLAGEKLRSRGFNQAALLAGKLGALLQIEVDGRSLAKAFETPPQAGLSRLARESNLKGTFKVKNNKKICGRNILLIDDVFTTGSTMSAAASALASAGAKLVFGLTVVTGRFI